MHTSPGRPAAVLTGIPDRVAAIEDHLVAIARLTAGLVEPVSYASVAALRTGVLSTVATSSDVALAVDLAQYADAAGPCLDAFNSGRAVSVPDIRATMTWPGYRDLSWRLGIRASLSIPLLACGGTPIAVLNLYGQDPYPMAALIRDVRTADDVTPDRDGRPSRGGCDVITGLVAALQVRDLIRQALDVVLGREHRPASPAYLVLRGRAAENGD